jgi:hypothetical protein
MNDHNGIVARIKRVLDSHDVEDQALINALILEALASNSQQLDNIRKDARLHADVHSKIGEEHSSRMEEWQEAQRKLNNRLDAIETIVFFPSRHPKRAVGVLLGVLFLLNLWFISGFREMFLRMLNAPDWLIQFLVPGAMP